MVDPSRVTASLLEDQFADDRAQEKAKRAAESRCFTVLMRVLAEVCNACQMEVQTTSWRQALRLALATLAVLANASRGSYSASDEPPAMSYVDDTPTPDFTRIHWTQMAVQGFVLREAVEFTHKKTRWIRVTSSGKFSDIHGDFTQREAEALLEAGDNAKVVAARDEKKNLICWSISHGDGPKLSGLTERMVEESRTFALLVKLRAQGWLLGPEGSDHAEVILLKPEQQ